MINPAIVIVGYNRINSIKRLLNSVVSAYYPEGEIDLIISLDYSDIQADLIEEIKKYKWSYGKVRIITHSKNLGLKKHVLLCGDLAETYGAVIILEDDLMVSPNFYIYTKQAIDFYKNDNRICGVALYNPPWNGYGNYQFMPQNNGFDCYIAQIGISWGQCWLKEQWTEFKKWYEYNCDIETFENDIPWSINNWGSQSWAKYFYNYMVEKDKYYVLPYVSLSTNFSDIGVHNNRELTSYQAMIMEGEKDSYKFPKFNDAIKYDMYFERILDNEIINGIQGEEICCNLYGYRLNTKKKYILTQKKYDGINYVCSFGLRMRPIEQNVLHNIPGEDIFLYKVQDIGETDISWYRRTPYKRINYEIYDNPLRRLEDYYNHELYVSLKNQVTEITSETWNYHWNYSLLQRVIEEKLSEKEDIGMIWMFHEVVEKYETNKPSENDIDLDTIERLINTFIDRGYNFVSLEQIINNPDKKNIALTFDDGYEGVYQYVFPICKKKKLPFCIFITCNMLDVEGYLTQKQLLEMNDCELCTIGAHTLNHSVLRYLDNHHKQNEIIEGKKHIEKLIGKKVDFFAYPYGSVFAVDSDSIEIVKEAGFSAAFSTINAHVVKEKEIKYFLPRINISLSSKDRLFK